VKCGGQRLSAGGHYNASSRALGGEEEVVEMKGKVRNKFFLIFPHLYVFAVLLKKPI
jgi:hypothetical protein